MKHSLVAHDRPIQVEKSSTFVVHLTSLKHPDDVKKDMYGRWTHSGSHPEVFRCSFDEFDDVVIKKCAPGASGSDVYYLRRIRSSHPSNREFHRMIAFLHCTRQKYSKPSCPPSDICVKHKEWREYFPMGSATPQSKYRNCYYHCNIP